VKRKVAGKIFERMRSQREMVPVGRDWREKKTKTDEGTWSA
jgi:hypothetical protein